MSQTANVIGLPANRGIGTIAGRLITESSFFRYVYNTDFANTFFNQFEFGEMCSIYHTGESTWQNYETLFDNPHASGNLTSDAEFNTFRPKVVIRESALLAPVQKLDRVKVRGIVHIVDDVVSDGVGVSTIFLRIK